jgi:riboflavin synthase
MFTGIVEKIGVVQKITSLGNAAKLEVSSDLPAEDIELGDSIAVNGVCQTVAEYRNNVLTFHALHETLQKTNLGKLQAGSEVNLETALRFGGKLGGHLVSGHVDCTAKVLSIKDRQGDIALSIARPGKDFIIVDKGSIAIDGISLTIAELDEKQFTVCIIPHTWENTICKNLKAGDEVNLEADMIGKFVQSLTLPYYQKKQISINDLNQAGF